MRPVVFIVALSLIILFAFTIDSYNNAFLAHEGLSALDKDIFYRSLGEFKDTVSDISYVKADVYYHGGIYDLDDDEHHNCIGLAASHGQRDGKHISGEHAGPEEIKPSLNILLAVGKAVHITEHRHLHGNEEQEILPWIYYSVRLNPHNVTAYAVGGYWLAVELKKPDKGIEFLKEGFANNPSSWEICQMLGQIYLLQKKDYKSALFFLEKAEGFIESQDTDKFDKRGVYGLLAETYARLEQKEDALKVYKKELDLFPGNKALERKIADL